MIRDTTTQQVLMDYISSMSSDTLISLIAKGNNPASNAIINGNTDERQIISYRENVTKQTILFNQNPQNKNVELLLKIKNVQVPWLYVNDSTIPNAGNGLFASRNFTKSEYFTVYMGKKLSKKDIQNGKFSKYAFANRDPCDRSGKQSHWYMLSHLINHAHSTKSNCKYDPKLRGYTTKNIKPYREFLMDYNRAIFCTICIKHEGQDINKINRIKCKPCKRSQLGRCSYCYSKQKQLVLRYCPNRDKCFIS